MPAPPVVLVADILSEVGVKESEVERTTAKQARSLSTTQPAASPS